MSEPTKTLAPTTNETLQLQSEGSLSANPPGFGLTAAPIQRQAPVEGETTAKEAVQPEPTTALPETFDSAAAIKYNDGKQLRLDWVRLLQKELLGTMSSTNGNFDQATVEALGKWQMKQWPGQKPDGKIGPNTRRQLEKVFPSLLTTTVGDHLESRILVPGEASLEQKYAYYKGMVETSGGVFLAGASEMNLVGIRGVKVGDGTEKHMVKGKVVAKGTIYQTTSAGDFAKARKSKKADDHFSGQHTGFDDMIVSLWVDEKGTMQVKERIGNVDPGDRYTKDAYKTGHLRDGQYSYKTGRHSTGSSSHRKAVAGIDDPDNVLNANPKYSGGKRTQYNALVPTRNQEVWRNSEKDDFSISEKEEATSNERIYGRNKRYVNNNFAMNIHTSRENAPNSQACQNVPANEYVDFMKEIQGSSNKKNILYSLIDASKIESGLQLVKQEDKSEGN